MLSSKKGERGIFIKFAVIEIIIVAYFIISYYIAVNFLEETQVVSDRLEP